MNDNVIEVKDVYKKYKNYFDKSHNLKEKIIFRKRNEYKESWVLNGISFEVKKGEAVGLIGRNGCGKSTTLKLLTKIIYPDRGSIQIKGRVSSLLELGAGFHPDLSGYENIYLNAAVFGLTRKEIDQRVDEIIRFSELKEFINNPIRTYSSGMYMKLAFSVAINVNADILLIDEILGVGDVSFQKKCFERLMEIKKSGTTIVIVSHSTDQIERICDRSLWISDGVIKQQGDPKEVHKNYLEEMEQRRLLMKQREELERISAGSRQKRKKERIEFEQRRDERKLYQVQLNNSIENGKTLADLQKEEMKEKETQKAFEAKAAQEREKQLVVQNTSVPEEAPIEIRRVEFFKREANRLELVVKEKNYEIERLNSVIRQKDLAVEKVNSEKITEILRLEKLIAEKEDEIDRLNEVIIEKNEEIDRINLIVMEKDVEIQEFISD